MDRDFVVTEPNKIWVSDITYLSVIGGFEYLTSIIDLYERKVVGYSLSRSLKAKDTVIPALNMAVKRRLNGILAPGLIFHSDRGVQYTCSDFTELLDKYEMVRSNLVREIAGIMPLMKASSKPLNVSGYTGLSNYSLQKE